MTQDRDLPPSPPPFGSGYIPSVESMARAEIRAEQFRKAVDAKKTEIRERASRSLWRRLFPWRVTITRD